MAPPASAMLTGASAVAGTFTHVYIMQFLILTAFFSLFVLVWKIHIKLHGVNLVSFVQLLYEYIAFEDWFPMVCNFVFLFN